MNWQRLGLILGIILLTLGLSSCNCGGGRSVINTCNPCLVGEPVPPVCPNPLTCKVQLCKEPIICTIPERNRRIAYLIQNGVKILHVGETITVVIPSDRLFYSNSANIHPCFREALKVASEYVFCYEKESVRIAAYTDCRCQALRNTALSQAQAKAVANALWCNGIDARLMYAVGYGPEFPIASNATPTGQAQNRRVEICFRYIPPYISSCSD
jgi:outer membrane protein OmpA-like peptidoglycan-associated protein